VPFVLDFDSVCVCVRASISSREIDSCVPRHLFPTLAHFFIPGIIDDLYIDPSELKGTLPTSMGDMTKLVWLQVSNSPLLTGPIPTEFGKLTALKELSMASITSASVVIICCVKNTRPGRITHIIAARLFNSICQQEGTGLTGSVPKEFGNLKNLGTSTRLVTQNMFDSSIGSGLHFAVFVIFVCVFITTPYIMSIMLLCNCLMFFVS
jgi:hypothetical protein